MLARCVPPWSLLVMIAPFMAAMGAPDAGARPLAEVKSRGVLALCANPSALPYASDKPDAPGFQVEIARALAAGIGVELEIDWIVPRMRAATVDCDVLLDTIALPDIDGPRLRLSHPYQSSGVALGLARGVEGIRTFGDLKREQRVGTMVGSLASVVLGKRGLVTVPYAFEDEMVDDLAKGALQAAACSPATIAFFRHVHPDSGIALVHAYEDEPELRWNVAVGMRRADDALVDAINKALDTLIADGTLERIYAHYGVEYRKP